jgi:hypothetical protein
MFDKLKNLFNKKLEAPKVEAPKKPREKKQPELTAKEKATQAGEPYINVLSMELDPNNIHEGAFELDWNSIFITQLVKAGYMKKKEDTDQDIVDRWFQDICRTVVLEYYQQQQADPDNRDLRNVRTRDLGNGRTEVS